LLSIFRQLNPDENGFSSNNLRDEITENLPVFFAKI